MLEAPAMSSSYSQLSAGRSDLLHDRLGVLGLVLGVGFPLIQESANSPGTKSDLLPVFVQPVSQECFYILKLLKRLNM